MDRNLLELLVRDVVSLIEKKNEDYGDSFYKTVQEFGDIAFVVRLCDKVNRLKALLSKGGANYESFVDTVKDIGGYCLLWLYYKKLEEVKRSTLCF